jgi:hypothetical protein
VIAHTYGAHTFGFDRFGESVEAIGSVEHRVVGVQVKMNEFHWRVFVGYLFVILAKRPQKNRPRILQNLSPRAPIAFP